MYIHYSERFFCYVYMYFLLYIFYLGVLAAIRRADRRFAGMAKAYGSFGLPVALKPVCK